MITAVTPTSAARRTDAISLLCADHARLAGLFETFETLTGNVTKKAYLAKLICMEIKLHSQVEEEVFYPAASAAIGDPSILDEDADMHSFGKQLTRELDRMPPDDPQFDTRMRMLGKYLRHHSEIEQREIFSKVMKAGIDLKELGLRILRRKDELIGDHERALALQIQYGLGMKA